MSALGQKLTFKAGSDDVRFVPLADIQEPARWRRRDSRTTQHSERARFASHAKALRESPKVVLRYSSSIHWDPPVASGKARKRRQQTACGPLFWQLPVMPQTCSLRRHAPS